MPCKMKDPAFRAEQHAHLHDRHIALITGYVDNLRPADRWLPYVAPLHGGVEARMLSTVRDTGKDTLDLGGSGMLSIENDDQGAAN